MEAVRDLLLGRPRAGLAPSLLLAGEITVPYGTAPSPEAVEDAWKARAGDRPIPAWILLGPADTPNGTVWKLAWCPPAAAQQPPDREVVLPEAAWVLEILDSLHPLPGWHSRLLEESPSGCWAGIWEGERCDRLLGPWPSIAQARERLAGHARSLDLPPEGEVRAAWHSPSPADLRRLAESRPESDLLSLSESSRRSGRRADATAAARVGSIAALFTAVSLGLGVWQILESRARHAEEVRLASVRPQLERISSLRRAREGFVQSLDARRDAALPNATLDRLVAGISRKVPAGTTLQAFQLESGGPQWRTRMEARVVSWDLVQPLAESLRKAPGVTNVSIASQNRSSDFVSVVLELRGNWP